MTLVDHDISAALGERYEPVRLIATGGMGEVWEATDTVLGRAVACKVLKREYAQDAGFRERFVSEARNAAQLSHPGVAGVFDYGERPGQRPFLVMELVDGITLTEALQRGPLDPERAREVVTQVADALGAAHAIGLVHRDVKPGNILITADGSAKLTDFGIARAADGVPLTRTGEIVGTPSYISPEQAEGRSATTASDVYALGCVLFECLTGEKPFTGEGPVATALAHLSQPVPALPADVPADLAAVTTRAMDKEPERRYATGSGLAAALRGDEGTQVLVLPGRDEVPPAAATTWWRRPWVRALAGLLVLLLAGTVLVAALSSGDGKPEAPATAPPETVRVVKAQYVGKEVRVVRAALKALGLTTVVRTQANPGGEVAGTVADLSPTGPVPPRTVIVLQVWGQAPPVEDKAGSGSGGGGKDTKGKPHKGKGKGKHG